MAPAGAYIADVAILEGSEFISTGFITTGYVGIPLQIKIFPSASFTNYQLNNWWVQEPGVRDFTVELLKLGYYLAGGYIPFKFSY